MPINLPASILLAFAYALTGWWAAQIPIPLNHVAVVYPAAGLALAAIMRFGPSILPGIYIGSLVVNVLVAHQGGNGFSMVLLIPPAAATIQALAGYWLTRWLIGLPTALDTPRGITLFMLVIAPASSLVGPMISVPALASAGFIAPDDALLSGFTWWLGDTLGILVAAPLALAFIGEPHELWRSRRLALGLPLVLLSVLTALVVNTIRHGEELTVREAFQREADQFSNQIKRRLATQVETLFATERFVALSLGFSREDFRQYSTPILERHPGTQNFTWNPLVLRGERATFESLVRFTDGLPDFRIVDRDDGAPNRTSPAAAADEYLPILFVEPLEHNRTVLGLNPLSIPRSAQAIALTRRVRTPIASEAFTLTQEYEQQRGVVIYYAVFQRTAQQERFVGLVSSAFRMDDVLESAIAQFAGREMQLCLVDLDAAAGNRRLSGVGGCERDAWMQSPLAIALPIDFASRRWEARVRGTSGYGASQRTATSWIAVIVGMLTTASVAAFLLIATGHARRISRLVDRRTSELASTTRDLERQRAALNRAQDLARMGSWEIDLQSGRITISERLRMLLKLPGDEPPTLQALLNAFDEQDRPRLEAMLAAAMEGESPAWQDFSTCEQPPTVLHTIMEGQGREGKLECVRATAQDVTASRRAEDEIRRLALHDALTGLANRTAWMNKARAAVKVARRHQDLLAVLFLDLDQFKTINDSLGHTAGDQLLMLVSRRLADSVREEDVLARLGGDEFVALLPRLRHAEDAATVAKKILTVLSQPIEIDGHEFSVSVSIGISVFPDDGGDVDTLLKHADTAMYSVKDAGRNNFQFFIPEMNARALDRLMLESGLRRAVERNELELHYQPQFDSRSSEIVGVEALLRWTHPEMGSIPPDRFIPVAENCGLISSLGAWVMTKALRQQCAWAHSGRSHLIVAVNVSALQFRKPGFVEGVQQLLRETGANPARIELEITESALMEPSESLFAQLDRLVALGVNLSLDDFGTGYSCLAYLKRLPIHRLKLDRSFVKDLPGDVEDAAIASAALSMARDLGIEVVAEGVETEMQRAYLAERGCHIMQGYLFSRPVPLSAFEAQFPQIPSG